MTKRNRAGRSRKSKLADESQVATALTVFWMLCALATASAELMWLAARVAMRFSEEPFWGMLTRLALLIATVTGTCALLATPLVLRVRRGRVPTSLLWGVLILAACAICLAILSS